MIGEIMELKNSFEDFFFHFAESYFLFDLLNKIFKSFKVKKIFKNKIEFIFLKFVKRFDFFKC